MLGSLIAAAVGLVVGMVVEAIKGYAAPIVAKIKAMGGGGPDPEKPPK